MREDDHLIHRRSQQLPPRTVDCSTLVYPSISTHVDTTVVNTRFRDQHNHSLIFNKAEFKPVIVYIGGYVMYRRTHGEFYVMTVETRPSGGGA